MKHGITISLYDVDFVDVKSAIWSTSLVGWVFRVTTLLHRYFMGETRDGYIETRVIRAQLKFEFSGAKTAVFKPGMPFEGHVYVMYDDDQALSPEKLAGATIMVKPVVTSSNGQLKTPCGDCSFGQKEESQRNNEFDNCMEHQIYDVKFSQFRAIIAWCLQFSNKFSPSFSFTSCYYAEQIVIILSIKFTVPKDANKSMRISAT